MSAEEHASRVDYPKPFDALAVSLCRSATRCVRMLSPDLDPVVFNTDDLTNAVSALARDTRQTEVRILVSDSRMLFRSSHKLLALARRLPSSVALRSLKEHPDWNGETVVIRNHDGFLYRHDEGRSGGFYEPDSRVATRRHLEFFDALWRLSAEDPELRSMRL